MKEKGITILRAKVKVAEYPENIMKDGLFNPICPMGYNYITGYTECKDDNRYQNRKVVTHSSSMSGRINGSPINNFN